MLFHELYGCYYTCVSHILEQAVKAELSETTLRELITTYAFPESFLVIEAALSTSQWQLLRNDLTTPCIHIPSRPLTLLEKRWLKAISLDPRIQLFEISFDGLEDITPLYTPEDIVYFDQYLDRDNVQDPDYIKNFHKIRHARSQHRLLEISFITGKGKRKTILCQPMDLEYSLKDDKFRLYVLYKQKTLIINLSRILSVELKDTCFPETTPPVTVHKKYILMELVDQRNALERVMMHFAHFEKEAQRMDQDRYQVKIIYDRDDETELLIRVLSFGPFVKVIEPASFVSQIKQRLLDQKNCGL